MFKRFGVLVLVSLLVLLPAGGAVSAESNIWQSLWNGINLNITLGDNSRQKPAGESRPAPVREAAATGTYAALGDSVAAGLGLSAAAVCGRSPQAYPYLVARETGLTLTHLACSGATAGDLVTRQRVSGPNIPAQLPRAFANGTPKLITITAGANDAHWDDFIRSCYAFDCTSEANTLAANAFLAALQLKLLYVFSDIQARSSGKPPRVIVTGYYNPLSERCASLQRNITRAEINWLNAEASALNQTIHDVVKLYPFVSFVTVDFRGHDICSDKPWVQGLNDPAPFHPNAKGQRVIGQAVLSAYRR